MIRNSISLVDFRDRATDLICIPDSYADWVPSVKALVRNASEDDFGTFIASKILLESAIPYKHKDNVEKLIKLNDYKKEKTTLLNRKTRDARSFCVTLSVISSVIAMAALIIISLCNGTFFGGFKITYFSAVYGIVLFSLIGGFLSGISISYFYISSDIQKNHAFLLSCMAGFSSAFLCVLFPPLVLIISWFAYHESSFIKPRLLDDSMLSSKYKKLKSKRVYARNPMSPQFVKSALRLAGIYNEADSYIGEIASRTLKQDENDYGAFVSYNAILSDFHNKVLQDNVYKTNNPNPEMRNNRHISLFKVFMFLSGFFFATLCSAAFILFLVLNSNLFPLTWTIVLSTFTILVNLIICGANFYRLIRTSGLSRYERTKIICLKCSWFTIWFDFVLFSIVFIIFSFCS